MSILAKAYSREFRDDVVAVARKGQSPLKQIAKDFGISEGCLRGWMKKADIEDGNRPGVTAADQLQDPVALRCTSKLQSEADSVALFE